MGQLGLGTSNLVLREFSKPALHTWVEQARQGQTLGLSDGAGIETMATGGMHTLAIDEVGKVSF